MKEELRKYIESYIKPVEETKSFSFMVGSAAKFNKNVSYECADACMCKYADSSLDNFLKDNEDKNKFQTVLFKYIDNKNLKDSDVYNKVHIDRRLFSKIRSDEEYHPSKETVLLLGLSLELNETEIEELLDSASYSLPKNNYYDLIMRFCFKNKIYNLSKVNDLLDEYKCKLFNY